MSHGDAIFGGVLGGTIAAWLGALLMLLAIAALTDTAPPDCAEDAVYAWQQNAGEFPDNVTWACIALDDLNRLEAAR